MLGTSNSEGTSNLGKVLRLRGGGGDVEEVIGHTDGGGGGGGEACGGGSSDLCLSDEGRSSSRGAATRELS